MSTVRRSFAVLLTALVAFLGTNLGSAQAVQLYGASGSYGSISPGYVTAGTTNTCYPAGNCLQRQVRVPGPTVGRSPSATAAQNVRIQYRVYRWNGSAWALYKSATYAYSMGYNRSVKLPQVNFNVGTGYYTVQESLSWHVSSTGMQLGARGVAFNGYDYACSSQLSCSTGAGWAYFG
jgi:hypothetical protein